MFYNAYKPSLVSQVAKTTVHWDGSISAEQVASLNDVFAKPISTAAKGSTPSHLIIEESGGLSWVIPKWLFELKVKVLERDKGTAYLEFARLKETLRSI